MEMFGNRTHNTKRLTSAAAAACVSRFELAAALPIFKVVNQVNAFLKNSGTVLTKATCLGDLRADVAWHSDGRLVLVLKERSNTAFFESK